MVGVPVYLYDERSCPGAEVDNGRADDDLAPKGDTELASTKAGPKKGLRRRRMKAHEVSPLLERELPRKTWSVKLRGLRTR